MLNPRIILLQIIGITFLIDYSQSLGIPGIVSISKIARTALLKGHDYFRGRRDANSVSVAAAEDTLAKYLDDVMPGLIEKNLDLTELEDDDQVKKNTDSAESEVLSRKRRGFGQKLWNFSKCRTVYYLINPKECSKTDLF